MMDTIGWIDRMDKYDKMNEYIIDRYDKLIDMIDRCGKLI